jgi:elongation factor G
VRVYAGVLRRGETVAVGGGRGKLRVGRLVRLFADQREEVDEAPAGSIVAVVGAELSTGETLSDLEHRILLEPVRAPEAVMRVAIEPRTRSDRERLPRALARLRIADPSLRVVTDPDTGQTLLGGMGQLHLEIAVSRLCTEHGVTVDVGAPRVAYRETISATARVEHVHKKRTGGPGQFAHVVMELEPSEPGAGFAFEDRISGGAIPREYVPGVRKGCEAAMTSGVHGYPVVDVAVTLLDGSTHPVDSSELAFAIAAEHAFRQACREAGPVLLEPLVRLEVRTPEAHVGDVIGDLSARRGRVLGMTPERDLVAVTAEVPLAELFGYASDLGSLTRGRGAHHMELARYAPAPAGTPARA